MATDRQPRNPYFVGLGVVGGIAGAIAVTLATIAGWLANEENWTTDSDFLGSDVAAIARLFAWADLLGLVAIVTVVGALVIAGARWAPKAPATNVPRPDPPGGLTEAERRLLGQGDTP